MWKRLAATRLHALFRQFPAVFILGARQVGKTTLALEAFPDIPYCDLEEPRLRQLFTEDPTFQAESRAQPSLILDEAQSVPQIFAALRGLIDRQRSINGRFLLLGSAQPSLIRQVSESLAGRVGILELDPLTALEVHGGIPPLDWRQLWLQGGFPDATRGAFREWWEAYLRTYVERDLPYMGVGADPVLLRRILTMLAHAQGGIFNASQFGQSLGISYHTVQRYIDILEQTFLVRRLQPYFRDVGKRLVKSPKVYIRDTGLLHHLLNISSHAELDNHPVRGASWETFVIEDIVRRERFQFPYTQCYFWRTQAGVEVDLVLDRGSEQVAIEIKVGHGAKPQAVRALAKATLDIGATNAWFIDQADSAEPLRPNIQRRGFAESLGWLPPETDQSTKKG